MELPDTLRASSYEQADLRRALFTAHLSRFTQGLLATGLVEDVQEGPVTLLAPNDASYDGMPWRFEDLLFDERLLEARFDFFEYGVIRGRVSAEGTRTPHVTMQGEAVRIGNRLVYGRYGASRVVRTIESSAALIHVLEQCVYPWDPKLCLARRST